MLVCLVAPVVAPVVLNLFALDEVLSKDFLSPIGSLSASILLFLRFNLLSKLCLLNWDILQIMLSYLLDCYYLSLSCFHLFPLIPLYTFPQVRVNVTFLYYHSFEIKFLCFLHLFPPNSVCLYFTLFILLLVLSSHPLNPVHLIFNGF